MCSRTAPTRSAALGALNRVYLNIGLFSEEWLLHFRAIIGGKPITPIPIATAEKNSVYWRATEMRTPDMARFFFASTEPHHLKDAPGAARYLNGNQAALVRGKEVFAERCARCHSSKLPDVPAGHRPGERQRARLPDEVEPSTGPGRRPIRSRRRCARSSSTRRLPRRQFPVDRAARAGHAPRHQRLQPPGDQRPRRQRLGQLLVAVIQQLPAVGSIKVRHPVTGAEYDYPLAGGGRGYIRPASPHQPSGQPRRSSQNNTVGHFEWSPSVEARMKSFDDSIDQMLWPEKRQKDALFLNETGPGVGIIDRITVDSYLEVSENYIPDYLRPFVTIGRRLFPFITGGDYSIKIGPFPKGMPVGLITNMDMLGSELTPAEQEEHRKKVLSLCGARRKR